MPVNSLHGLQGVYTASAGIGGITDQNIVTGNEVRGEATSGEVFARILALFKQKIAPRFSTRSITAALDVTGVGGASIATVGPVSMYAQAWAAGGSRATGSAHRKFTFSDGMILPRTLTVEQGGEARLDVDIVTSYDGTNDPIIIADAQSLPVTALTDAMFTLGGVTIGGVALTGVRRFQIDFGLDVVTEAADGDLWDTYVGIRAQQSVITVETTAIATIAAAGIPLSGKAATHANTTLYVKKMLHGGSFVPDATAEHIAFTACGMIAPDSVFGASGNNPGTCGFRMPCSYDGTNLPITVSTASAIV